MLDVMGVKRSAALARRFPKRVEVPILIFASGVLLTAGLVTPALETRTLLFWREEYGVVINIFELGEAGRKLAAVLLTLFAIIYPATKLLMLGYFWILPFPHEWRFRLIHAMRLLGRWSMIDVIAISAIVLGSMTIGPLEAKPQTGLFLYSGGILCLMVVTLMMDQLAKPKRR